MLGFIPAAWLCGLLAKKDTKANLINYSFYTGMSLCVVHIIGIIYIIIGKVFGNWLENLSDLILINTFTPFPTQLLLCIAISLLSILLRRVLIIK